MGMYMVKIPKKMMSPFYLAEPLADSLKAYCATKGLPLSRAYEQAISALLESGGENAENGQAEGIGGEKAGTGTEGKGTAGTNSEGMNSEGKGTPWKVYCPPGMVLLPSVPVPAYVHAVLVQEVEKLDGWAEMINLAVSWWLEAKHKKPREPQPKELPLTPEQKKAQRLERDRETARIRFQNGCCPVVCGVVFRHRKPEAEPWRIIGLDGPSFEPEDVAKAKRLCEEEYAEVERQNVRKAQEELRREREREEPREMPLILRQELDRINKSISENLQTEDVC